MVSVFTSAGEVVVFPSDFVSVLLLGVVLAPLLPPPPPELLLPGDFVQLRFDAPEFGHTPVVVEVGSPPALDRILVAAHSQDADLRPLSTYSFREIRGIHILGVRS